MGCLSYNGTTPSRPLLIRPVETNPILPGLL
jgi:hypothetical protein